MGHTSPSTDAAVQGESPPEVHPRLGSRPFGPRTAQPEDAPRFTRRSHSEVLKKSKRRRPHDTKDILDHTENPSVTRHTTGVTGGLGILDLY